MNSTSMLGLPQLQCQHKLAKLPAARRPTCSCRKTSRLLHCTAGPAAIVQETSKGDVAETPQEQLSWQACVQHMQSLGFPEEDADRFVQRAFGWGAKAKSYWRHEKDKQPADLQQVIAALHFLSQLGMTDEQVVKTVKNFPEVLGCDVQQQLQANVDKLYVDWKLQGDVLVKAVLRNPAVLGYNLDCMGDCAGECNRCWARF